MYAVSLLLGWLTAATVAAYALTLRRQLRQHRRDPLTGLPTRAAFTRAARRRIQRDHLTTTVALLDLNNFKPLNDTYGHAAGDYVLAVVADRLREHFAMSEALICRLGGDEFAVVFRQQRHMVAPVLLNLAKRLAKVITLPEAFSTQPVQVTASIGAVHLGATRHATLSAALHHADGLMYQAKREAKRDHTGVVVETPECLHSVGTTTPVARQRWHGPYRLARRVIERQITSRAA